MNDLYKTYKEKGLEILAYPCNQFESQEPGSRQEIKAFARIHQNSQFPLFDKVDVNGPSADEVFKFLRFNSPLHKDDTVGHIHWNFGKFLVNSSGKVISYFHPMADPDLVKREIK